MVSIGISHNFGSKVIDDKVAGCCLFVVTKIPGMWTLGKYQPSERCFTSLM